jgi:hypothetical protein
MRPPGGEDLKNQYVGDIGDYTKLGLMRAIQETGLSIGINWYLTPNDNRPDGRHIQYLSAECDTPDIVLYNTLKHIVGSDLRLVAELEQSNLLSNTVYFNDLLDFSNYPDKKQFRDAWHKKALSALGHQQIVFLDPDNGLEVKSAKPYSMNGNKYATYQEVADYFIGGASVIVYNHRDRTSEAQYIERLTRFRQIEGTSSAYIFCLRASRFSVRDYLFITQAAHIGRLKESIGKMLCTGWEKYLAYREI